MVGMIGIPNIRLDLLTVDELKQKYNETLSELNNLHVNNCTPEYKEGVEHDLDSVTIELARRDISR